MAAAGGSWKGGAFVPASGTIRAGMEVKVGNETYTLTSSDARQINEAIERVRNGEISRSDVATFAGGSARFYQESVNSGRARGGTLQRAAAYRAIANELGITPRTPRTAAQRERDQAEYESRSRPRTRTEYALETERR